MKALQFSDGTAGTQEDALKCPECGFDYTHLTHVFSDLESDDGNSRLCASLHFECENGHHFVVRVNQHKGATTMGAELRAGPS